MKIIEDKREISCIKLFDGHIQYNLPKNRIEAYEENGEMAPVIWFKIFVLDADQQGETLIVRVNSKFVSEIIY